MTDKPVLISKNKKIKKAIIDEFETINEFDLFYKDDTFSISNCVRCGTKMIIDEVQPCFIPNLCEDCGRLVTIK